MRYFDVPINPKSISKRFMFKKKWGFSLGFQGGIIVKGSQCYVPSGWLLLLPRIQALRTGLREKQKPGTFEANCQATWRFVFLGRNNDIFFSRFKNRIPSLQCHYRRSGIQIKSKSNSFLFKKKLFKNPQSHLLGTHWRRFFFRALNPSHLLGSERETWKPRHIIKLLKVIFVGSMRTRVLPENSIYKKINIKAIKTALGNIRYSL